MNEIKICCDGMRDAINDRFVAIGDYEYPSKNDKTVNIYKCFPWPEGASWDSMEIKFCPFCGKKIEVKE